MFAYLETLFLGNWSHLGLRFSGCKHSFPQSNEENFLIPPIPLKPSLSLLTFQHQGHTRVWHWSACTAVSISRAFSCSCYHRKIKQDFSFQLIQLLNWLEESILSSTSLAHPYRIDQRKCLTMQFTHISKHLFTWEGPWFQGNHFCKYMCFIWVNGATGRLKKQAKAV